eukprot:UN25014
MIKKMDIPEVENKNAQIQTERQLSKDEAVVPAEESSKVEESKESEKVQEPGQEKVQESGSKDEVASEKKEEKLAEEEQGKIPAEEIELEDSDSKRFPISSDSPRISKDKQIMNDVLRQLIDMSDKDKIRLRKRGPSTIKDIDVSKLDIRPSKIDKEMMDTVLQELIKIKKRIPGYRETRFVADWEAEDVETWFKKLKTKKFNNTLKAFKKHKIIGLCILEAVQDSDFLTNECGLKDRELQTELRNSFKKVIDEMTSTMIVNWLQKDVCLQLYADDLIMKNNIQGKQFRGLTAESLQHTYKVKNRYHRSRIMHYVGQIQFDQKTLQEDALLNAVNADAFSAKKQYDLALFYKK